MVCGVILCMVCGDETCTDGEWLVGDICGWFAVSCDEFGRVNGFLFGK